MWLNAIITLTVYGHGAFRTKVLGLACAGAGLPSMAAEVATPMMAMQGQVGTERQVEHGSGRLRRWGSRWRTAKGRCSGNRGTAWGQPKARHVGGGGR